MIIVDAKRRSKIDLDAVTSREKDVPRNVVLREEGLGS
jgi:hypothetical protein